MNKTDTFKNLYKELFQIANKYLRCQESNSGYYVVNIIDINIENNTFSFTYTSSTPGMLFKKNKISLDYLNDNSNLEKDAVLADELERKKKLEEIKLRERLKNSKDVKDYLALERSWENFPF